MKSRWILIANATHARVLRQDGGPAVLVKSFTHLPGSKFGELIGDCAGPEGNAAGAQPRAVPSHTDHDRFARELAGDLERQAQLGRYHSLAVFASSPFLGELEADFGPATVRLLAGTHDMDLTNMGPAELARCIAHAAAP